MPTYKAGEVTIAFNGYSVTGKGLADGVCFSYEWGDDKRVFSPGGDGEGIVVKRAHEHATGTVTLKQNSDANRVFQGFEALDTEAVFTFRTNLGESGMCRLAQIQRPPNGSFDTTDTTNREWNFIFPVLKVKNDPDTSPA